MRSPPATATALLLGALLAVVPPVPAGALGSASAPGQAPERAGAEADAPSPAAEALAAGDRAWSERARRVEEEEVGLRWAPDPRAAERAAAAYERAVEAAPEDLEAHRKLLEALYFLGEHVASGSDERREVFDRGKAAGEAALDRVAAAGGIDREELGRLEPAGRAARISGPVHRETAAALHLWTAVHWGLWADVYGALAAVREGVAGTVRDHAETAIALDPKVERGGPHRVLGRLHAEAPKVPFFTGWIDRGRALEELERAVELGPDEPLNRLYLAEAILEHRRRRTEDALVQLRAILERPPAPPRAVEETAAQRTARRILAEETP